MSSSPLPKSSLLTKTWQYNDVYKNGTRCRGKGVSLIFRVNDLREDRIGISISGVRLAVQRNRVKRLIKEFFRHNRLFPSQVAKRNGCSENVDMVIATRKDFSPNSVKDLSQALKRFVNESRRQSKEVYSYPIK